MKKKKYIETTVLSILNSRSKKTAVILLTLVIFGISIMLIPTMFVKGKLLPKPTADRFSIYVDLPEGKSVYETKEVTSCIVDQLKDQEIVTDMTVFLGESGPVDFSAMLKGRVFASGENMATITVNLKKEALRDEDSILAVNRLRPVIQNTCSINGANIKMIEEPAGPPVLASLVLEITSTSRQDSMENVAEKIVDIFNQTETLVDIDTDSDSTYTQHGITLNYNKIAKSGLALPQVKKILYLAFEGMNIAYVDKANSNNQIPIHLVLSHETKKLKDANSSTLKNKLSAVQLMNAQGILMPLSELITITERMNEHKIMSKTLMPIVSAIAEADMESAIYPLLDA
nr:efflux RND transporter permease subunit [Sulfurovaceae bacterium]